MSKQIVTPVIQYTWNPWRGCTKISPGCKNCYMFRQQERYGNDPARIVRTKTGRDPLCWQKKAGVLGRTNLAFTCSPISAKILLAWLSPKRVTLANGRRNWPAIWAAAERVVRRELARDASHPAERKSRSTNVK